MGGGSGLRQSISLCGGWRRTIHKGAEGFASTNSFDCRGGRQSTNGGELHFGGRDSDWSGDGANPDGGHRTSASQTYSGISTSLRRICERCSPENGAEEEKHRGWQACRDRRV